MVHLEYLESLLKIMRRRKETSVKETQRFRFRINVVYLAEHAPVKIRQTRPSVSGPAFSPNHATVTNVQRRPPGLPGAAGQAAASRAAEAGARGRGQDFVSQP